MISVAKVLNKTRNQNENTISLQLQVSVNLLYTFDFAYSMLSVILRVMCVQVPLYSTSHSD
jgi:hypothetical protein